jgi:hypothetical protein
MNMLKSMSDKILISFRFIFGSFVAFLLLIASLWPLWLALAAIKYLFWS